MATMKRDLSTLRALGVIVSHVGDKPSETRDQEFNRIYNIPLATLQGMRALAQGQADNLVYESPRFRVWVSRMTQADYDGDSASYLAERRTFEEKIGGVWVRLDRYGNRV